MSARSNKSWVWTWLGPGLLAMVGCGGPSTSDIDLSPPKRPDPPPRKEPPPPPPKPPEPPPPPPPRPTTAATIDDAETAAAEVYADNRRTFYCGCRYTTAERVRRATCGYKVRADESRAKRMVWTHVVPSRAFGAGRRCWSEPVCTREDGTKYSGVECCLESDEEFRIMATDLFNLVPAIEEIAWDRSNYHFGDIEGRDRLYGACDFEVDREAERVEPPDAVRGDIARTYLYMNAIYGEALPLTDEERAMFGAWSQADPPDDWELSRAEAIVARQKLANPVFAAPPPEDASPSEASAEGDAEAGAEGGAEAGAVAEAAEDAAVADAAQGGEAPGPDAAAGDPSAGAPGQADPDAGTPGAKTEGPAPSDGKKTDGKKTDGKKADGKKTDGKKTDGKKADGKKTDGKKTAGKKTDGKKADGKKTDGKKTDADGDAPPAGAGPSDVPAPPAKPPPAPDPAGEQPSETPPPAPAPEESPPAAAGGASQ